MIYKVEQNKKKLMLEKANIAWKNFKSKLSREYIWTKDMEIRKEPPRKYDFISKSDWTEFIATRLTEDWEVIMLDERNLCIWRLLRTVK